MNEGIKIDTKITQIGNSLGVIIPSAFCNEMKIQKGTPVTLELQPDKIIIRNKNIQA